MEAILLKDGEARRKNRETNRDESFDLIYERKCFEAGAKYLIETLPAENRYDAAKAYLREWLPLCAEKGVRAVRAAARQIKMGLELVETCVKRGKELVPRLPTMDALKLEFYSKFTILRVNNISWRPDHAGGDNSYLPVIQCQDARDPDAAPVITRLETIKEAEANSYDQLRRITRRGSSFCRVSRALARRELHEGASVLARGLREEGGEHVASEFEPVDLAEIERLRARVQGSSQPQSKPAPSPDQSQPKPAPRWNSPSR